MAIKKITATQLHEKLQKGAVKFCFTKKDGTLRTAVGTLNLGLIPSTHRPAGGNCPPKNVGYTPYYDIEKKAFRVYAEKYIVGEVVE